MEMRLIAVKNIGLRKEPNITLFRHQLRLSRF
jgi:hypothetical protein